METGWIPWANEPTATSTVDSASLVVFCPTTGGRLSGPLPRAPGRSLFPAASPTGPGFKLWRAFPARGRIGGPDAGTTHPFGMNVLSSTGRVRALVYEPGIWCRREFIWRKQGRQLPLYDGVYVQLRYVRDRAEQQATGYRVAAGQVSAGDSPVPDHLPHYSGENLPAKENRPRPFRTAGVGDAHGTAGTAASSSTHRRALLFRFEREDNGQRPVQLVRRDLPRNRADRSLKPAFPSHMSTPCADENFHRVASPGQYIPSAT